MTRDILYDAAFRYKKAGLWKKLWDTDIFALKLRSGETAYIAILGKNGEYNAISLYIGEEGFNTYHKIANLEMTGSEFKVREALIQQKCLQLALETKEALSPEEIEEVRAYAKKNGIRLAGKNAWPQFLKYEPGCFPWKVETDEDMAALLEAAEACILLADFLKKSTPEALGIMSVSGEGDNIPLFEVKDQALLQAGMIPLPEYKEDEYEFLEYNNEIALAGIKRLTKKGNWETELIRLPRPAQNEPDEAPFYPMMVMVVDSRSGYLLPVSIGDYEKNPQAMLDSFAEAWKAQRICPREIRCRDERTYAFLKNFCEKINSKIRIYDGEMPMLDEAQEAMLEEFIDEDDDFYDDEYDDEEYAEIIDDYMLQMAEMILNMSKTQLKTMPKELRDNLKMLIAHEAFPAEIAKELEKKLKGL